MNLTIKEVNELLEALHDFLIPIVPILNRHMVDYFTKSHWKSLPNELRESLEEPDSSSLIKNHIRKLGRLERTHENNVEIPKCKPKENENSVYGWNIKQLLEKIEEIYTKAENMKVSYTQDGFDYKGKRICLIEENVFAKCNFDPIMSEKKKHEVEVLSDLIYKMSKKDDIQYLVDLGSGKGYLPTFLTLLLGFNGLALDSSAVTVNGCAKRTANIKKYWSGLLKRAEERKLKGFCSKRGRVKKKRTKTSEEIGNSSSQPLDEKAEKDEGLKNLLMYVKDDLDLETLIRQTFPKACLNEFHFGLVGLHTCGNLGVTSLRLFLNSSARFVCNVPCCFHLLLEEDDECIKTKPKPKREKDEEEEMEGNSFPLSNILIERKCKIGRTARMLSSFSYPRLSSNDEKDLDPPLSLYYRALFQALIEKKIGHHVHLNRQVGKICDKVPNFNDYVKLGLKKIDMEHLEVSDADIENVILEFDGAEKKTLQNFYLLRCLFAPLIEAIVLFDRLAFLLQQESVEQALIVKLFDPSISPRCNAIVAMKR